MRPELRLASRSPPRRRRVITMPPPDLPDNHPLRVNDRPDFEIGPRTVRVVDLFSGCGGLTLGVAQAAHEHGWATEVALAVDADMIAAAVYQANFPKAAVQAIPVESIFDGNLGCPHTASEQKCRDGMGRIEVLVGGPPCQGHSNLNNHTRRNDPKNALYLRMIRAAEVLKPAVILVENVPAVRNDKGDVVGIARTHLGRLGYQVGEMIVRLDCLGVPQKRQRHVLLATGTDLANPDGVFLRLIQHKHRIRDLRWAIGDLTAISNRTEPDLAPSASAANASRMAHLLRNDIYDLPNHLRPPCHQDEHSYKSMYGRLRWDEPAQTITRGFTSIGQGRYMHPDQPRALTVHEAARIQGFPDYFDFMATNRRTALATMIGNAAPPHLAKEIIGAALFQSA
jgi:DNA (cytosine-5)-methyltransferase 1